MGGVSLRTSDSKFSTYLTWALALCFAAIIIYAPLLRGLFFREDYLRFFVWVAWFFVAVAAASILEGRPLWDRWPDLAFLAVVVFYALSILWAKAKGQAIDGALKYCVYLGMFLAGKYLAGNEESNRLVRNAIVVSGIVAAMVGLLAAAGVLSYKDAVVGGRIFGSFQYPNALAAYEMFVSFFAVHAWFETQSSARGWLRTVAGGLYSVACFLILTVIVLSYSRATWLIYLAALLGYFPLLPRGVRGQVFLRFATTLVPVLAVNVPLATAIGKNQHPEVRKYLLMGASLSLILEIARAFIALRRFQPARVEVAEGSTPGTGVGGLASKPLPASQPTDQSSSGLPEREVRGGIRRRYIFLAGVLIALALAVSALALATPQGQKLLSKVLPAAVVARIRSITLVDRSLLMRFFATKDAFLIALEHPLGTGAGGWNVLYHRYQTVLYWFTETHNHFAQVLVETGFPGFLAYVLFWGYLVVLCIRSYLVFRKVLGSGEPIGYAGAGGNIPGSSGIKAQLLAWFSRLTTAAFAVFSLAVHSSLDFELSLPAVAISLFAAVGVLSFETRTGLSMELLSEELFRTGKTSERKPSMMFEKAVHRNVVSSPEATSETGSKSHQAAKEQKKGFKNARKAKGRSELTELNGLRPLLDALSIIILAILIIVPCKRYFHGMALGSLGIQRIIAGRVEDGREFLLAAIKYDPHTSSYALDLARTYVQEYAEKKDEASRGMAKLYLGLARRTNPLDLENRTTECQMLFALNLYDESVQVARELMAMIPLDIRYYELLASTAKTAILNHLDTILAGTGNGKDLDERLALVKKYVGWLGEIPKMLDNRKSKITGLYARAWDPKQLDISPRVALVLGEASYLAGDAHGAVNYLTSARRDGNIAQEANTWLYYLAAVTGTKVALPQGFKPSEGAERVAKLYGFLK